MISVSFIRDKMSLNDPEVKCCSFNGPLWLYLCTLKYFAYPMVLYNTII